MQVGMAVLFSKQPNKIEGKIAQPRLPWNYSLLLGILRSFWLFHAAKSSETFN